MVSPKWVWREKYLTRHLNMTFCFLISRCHTEPSMEAAITVIPRQSLLSFDVKSKLDNEQQFRSCLSMTSQISNKSVENSLPASMRVVQLLSIVRQPNPEIRQAYTSVFSTQFKSFVCSQDINLACIKGLLFI